MSSPDVSLVSGHVSADELAAIAVAVSAMSVASREEAHERELAERAGAPRSTWASAIHRMPQAVQLRSVPGTQAWKFSHR